MTVIQVANVSKCFHLQPDRPRSFQELVVSLFSRRPRPVAAEIFWALRDVSFSVAAGETLGIIGSNGTGKSTCLKLLTRILEPTSGTVRVDGRISALLELGAGFHPELTGRENVFLHGSVLGLSRREMTRRFEDIVAFAELEQFIDIPVKFYSSGMYVRLAFATAINVNPDILLIDEVLAVGDQSFQDKCLDHIRGLKGRGLTIVFVSHDLNTVRDLCDRVIWLDDGILCDDGNPDEVIAHYLRRVYKVDTNPPPIPEATIDGSEAEEQTEPGVSSLVARLQKHWGSHEAEIDEVCWLDSAGQRVAKLKTGAPATIVVRYVAHQRIEDPVFGLAVHRDDGLHLTGSNTRLAQYSIPWIEGAGEIRYHINPLPLLEGIYYLSAAIHSADEQQIYDYQRLLHRFEVERGDVPGHEGVLYMPAAWEHITISVAETEDRP